MKNLVLSFFAALGAFTLTAETFVWTGGGATNAKGEYLFTNAANWKVEKVGGGGEWAVATRAPGMIWDCKQNAQSFTNAWASYDAHPTDEIVFGACTLGDMSIDLSGHVCVSNITFSGNTPVYTFKNYPLGIGRKSTFEIQADTANLPVLEKGLSAGTDVSNSVNAAVYVINNKAGSQLELPAFGLTSLRIIKGDFSCSCYFRGTGGLRFGKIDASSVVWNFNKQASGASGQVVHRSLYFAQEGKLDFYLANTTTTGNYNDRICFQGATNPNVVEFAEGACLYTSSNGGNIRAYENTIISGPGTIYPNGTEGAEGSGIKRGSVILAPAGKTVYLRCRLGQPCNNKTLHFAEAYVDSGKDMSGTVDLTELIANDCTGGVYAHFPLTLKVAGIDGDPTVVSNAFGSSSVPVYLAGGAILAYAGPGETTARTMAIADLYKDGYNLSGSDWSTLATRKATLSQRGTGKWTVSGFSIASSGAVAELTLDNDTAFDAELASVIANDSAGAYFTDIVKTGSGKWILSAENTTGGKLTIQDGEIEESETGRTGNMTYFLNSGTTLRLLGSGTWRQMNLLTAQNGAVTVVIGAGATVRLNAVPVVENGGSVNFVLETGASLTCNDNLGLRGTYLPATVTVNGQIGFVNGTGSVEAEGGTVVLTDEIPAKGGVLTNGAEIVGITTEGTTGPITLDATVTTNNMLVHRSATDATVQIGADETWTVNTIALDSGAGALTVATDAGGAFTPKAGATLTLKNNSDSTLTVAAPLTLPSGTTVNMIGTGDVALPADGTWSGDFFLKAGSLALGDLDISSSAENVSFSYGVTATTSAALATQSDNAALQVKGETAADVRLALAVPKGEMTVSDGASIRTKSITIGGTGDAKLTLTGHADVYFPETNGVIQVGPTTGTESTGLAELVVENATLGAVFDPPGEGDYRIFASRGDRAIVVAGAQGDGLLRVKAGATVTNRLSLGQAGRKSACYLNGGEIVSLGGHCNYGGEQYTLLGYGEGNQSYLEQKAGTFLNYESLQLSLSRCNVDWVMTGGKFWVGQSPLSSDSSHAYVTFQSSNGEAAIYVGGDSTWVHEADIIMVDQGTGRCTFTADGNAQVRFLGSVRCGDQPERDMSHPHILNINGNSFVQLCTATLNKRSQNYKTDGTRIASPVYLNINGGTLVRGAGTGFTEFLPYTEDVKYQFFNRITLYENGGIFTPTNGQWSYVRGWVTNATGKGVFEIPLDEALTGSIVPPSVVIEGDGVAASALALFDSTTLTTTNILVTSHGVDYTWAQAKLYYGKTLVKTIDCELKENATGPLVFSGTRGYFNLAAKIDVPQAVFATKNTLYVTSADCLSSRTELTVNNTWTGFDNTGDKCNMNIPLSIRSDGVGYLRTRSDGGYTTMAFPVRGSTGLYWNSLTNYVIGCTTVDCATLVTNNLNGTVTTLADNHTKGLQFRDTATLAFTNLDALRDQDRSYTVMRWAPTQMADPKDFYGMPKLATELPKGWSVRKYATASGAEIRLVYRKGVAILAK